MYTPYKSYRNNSFQETNCCELSFTVFFLLIRTSLCLCLLLLGKYCIQQFQFHLQVCAIVSWDSSIHDSLYLNRVTPANERVYLILKTVVRLSHPAAMELVLRKRIAINVYKRQSITDRLKKRIGKAVSSVMG